MFNRKKGTQDNNSKSEKLYSDNNTLTWDKKVLKAFNNFYLRLRHKGHEESYYYNDDGTLK